MRVFRFSLDADLTSADAALERTWVLARIAVTMSRPLGLACAALGLAILAGYLGGVEAVYRPIAGGPATHPLTAATIVLIGLGLGLGSPRFNPWPQRILAVLAIAVTSIRLTDAAFGTTAAGVITPFRQTVLTEVAMGKSNAMGVNTAIMLFMISLALGANALRKPILAQVIAFVALGLPLVSFTGYAYGLETFYGQMSLTTASFGVFLSISALSVTAYRGGLRVFLSPYLEGRVARVQVALGVIIPFLLGFAIVGSMVATGGDDLVSDIVVTSSWITIALICAGAVWREQTEHRQRLTERASVFAQMSDPLPRLPDRRHVLDMGRREFARALRSGASLWVLRVEIDRFGEIADTAGAAVARSVLEGVSQGIIGALRTVDLIGHLGDEAFVVLQTDITPIGVRQVAELVRQDSEATVIAGWTDIHGPVTVSIGFAGSGGKETYEGVLAAATDALNRAKQAGGNRVAAEPGSASRADADW